MKMYGSKNKIIANSSDMRKRAKNCGFSVFSFFFSFYMTTALMYVNKSLSIFNVSETNANKMIISIANRVNELQMNQNSQQ